MRKRAEVVQVTTPWDIPHVPCNCRRWLKVLRARDGAAGTKSLYNSPDAALTLKGENMQVYVLNHKERPLMPCSPRRARVLLKEGKARVVRQAPFTIAWTVPTRSYVQPVTLGADSGYSHVGISAVTDKKEVYAADVTLRNDMVKLNSERREYRRGRRQRHTWYREPRFDNRKKPEGWLAPSIQNKLDTQVKVIRKVGCILPVSKVIVEVATFDIQKIKNPDIEGVGYQDGVQKGFWNVREYVLYRDGHKCQNCKDKSKDQVLTIHHIKTRQTGGDRPNNLVTVCDTCHGKISRGALVPEFKILNGFKAETFMTMVRWKIVDGLREPGIMVNHTYGYITKNNRIALGLPKSHVDDAFVVAGGTSQERASVYDIKQVRKCNRKLRKGDRSHIKNTAPRFVHGFQRYDKVLWNRTECFIFGRRSSGYFDLRKLDGTRIHKSASYKDLSLLESAQTLLTERTALLPLTSREVSAPQVNI
ncbi:MAG: RNA-guided endonuclease IscB [Syntrophales bacterium]